MSLMTFTIRDMGLTDPYEDLKGHYRQIRVSWG